MTPIIGDLISNTVGKVIGKLTDHYLPSSMSEAEKATFKLEAERLAIEELQANKSVIESVNKTMQAEANAKWWWSAFWRPLWGVISAVAFGAVTIFFCYLAYKSVVAGDTEALALMPQLISTFAMLFGIPGAILGVTAWHRGKMQRIQAGEVWGGK